MEQAMTSEMDNETLDNYFYECHMGKSRSRRQVPTISRTPTQVQSSVEESDVDTDLEDEATNQGPVRKRTTQEIYEAACKKYDVMPCTLFLDNLDNGDKVVSLRHKTLGYRDFRSIAVALVSNVTVTELDLTDNNIGPEGVQDIEALLTRNNHIRILDISNNKCGLDGAISLGEIIRHNDRLREIRASGCGFQERDAFYIVDALEHNMTLLSLDLSHNHLVEEGGILIGHAIGKTECVQTLNLSWNHLRMKGAQSVAFGLERNDSLTHLDLSWNGFTNEGAEALAEALKKNTSVTYLDVTCNRISALGARHLAGMLEQNTTLETLKISFNPITSEGAIAMVQAIKNNKTSLLKLLEIKGATVTHDIWIHTHDIQQRREEFELIYGHVVQSPDPMGTRMTEGVRERTDPFTLLMLYIENEGLRIWDMFSRLDKNGDMKLSQEEVSDGLRMLGAPVASEQLDELVKRLDSNNDGEIDFGELLRSTMKFRVKDRMEKIKHKRERSLQQQMTQIAKEKLVNLQIDDLKPLGGSRPVSGRRALSPSPEFNRPQSSKLSTASHTTVALRLTPDRSSSSTTRGLAGQTPARSISSSDDSRDLALSPNLNSSGPACISNTPEIRIVFD